MNHSEKSREQLIAELLEARRTIDELEKRCDQLSSQVESMSLPDENELGRDRSRFLAAVEGTGEGLWNWDIQSGDEWWSKRFYELLGYSDGEIESSFLTFIELLHPDDRVRGPKAVRAHLETGVPFDEELRLRTKSGEYRWYRSHAQAQWDENGKPLFMAGAIEDITALRESLRELLESQREFQLLAENVPGFFVIWMGIADTSSSTRRMLTGSASTETRPSVGTMSRFCRRTCASGSHPMSLLFCRASRSRSR